MVTALPPATSTCEGRKLSYRSRRRSLILADQSGDDLRATDLLQGNDDGAGSDVTGGAKIDPAVRPVGVVVGLVVPEEPEQMSPPEDEDDIEELRPHRLDEALGEGVGLR